MSTLASPNSQLALADKCIEALAQRLSGNDPNKKAEILVLWKEISQRLRPESSPRPEQKDSGGEKPGSCMHALLSGKNKGKPCGKKISPKSASRQYCSEHIKYEKLEGAQKIFNPSTIAIIRHKFGHLIDPRTNLVFDGEKFAIGKALADGSILPLDSEDRDFCKKQLIQVKYP